MYRGKRITIFSSDSGDLWKFCIADPRDRVEPIYSDWYRDADTAQGEAINLILGRALEAKTYRERKQETLRGDAPAILARSKKKLSDLEKAVIRLQKLKSPTAEQFDKLADRISDGLRTTQHAHHVLIECDAPAEIAKQAGEIPIAIIDLKDRLASVRAERLP